MSWYAVQTHTSYESQVSAWLDREGVQNYWPSREVKTRHARREETVRRSLFPGYLFVQIAEERRIVVATPRVVRILGFGDHPVEIPQSQIESVRILESSPTVEPCANFSKGQLIRVMKGPLSGAEGEVLRTKNGTRLVVSVNLLNRAVSAEVDAADLELRKAA